MKRTTNNFNYNQSKKQKIQDDDIWGDDPEIEEVDRCIDLASQICSQSAELESRPSNAPGIQDTNYSLINYDNFKQKSNLVASTQAFATSPIFKNNNNPKQLLDKIQILEFEKNKIFEEHETQKGEIAFLREKLKQAQNVVSIEKVERLKGLQENQESWEEKIIEKNKEVATLKCENELKTLEAANLRQKLIEVKKMYNSNFSLWNGESCSSSMMKAEKKPVVNNLVVYSRKNSFYPYREVFPSHLIFNFKENLRKAKLRDLTHQHNCLTPLFVHYNIESSKQTNLNDIFNFILKFANYTEDELNKSDEVMELIVNIEKYIKEYFLIKLNKTFQSNKAKNNLYLNRFDIKYNCKSLFSTKVWSEFELETDIRRLIAVVATICQHSSILYNYLHKQLNNQLYVVDNLETNFNLELFKEMDFLQTILQITILVKNYFLTEQFCGFLASTLKLLSVIVHKEILSQTCYNYLFQIFKQILFAQPNQPVLQYICYFLKYVSEHHYFMSLLCARNKSNNTQIKDGLLYFSDDTCTLKVLASTIETCKFQVDIARNLMYFLQNLVTCNLSWMYHQDQCGCLSDIYGLGINILYKSLEKFIKYQQDHKDIRPFLTIFHNGILFLHVLTVRIPDLVAKCTSLYSQYQTIIKYMYKIRTNLLLTTTHESELDHLMSQLNCDIENNSEMIISTSIDVINDYYHRSFLNF